MKINLINGLLLVTIMIANQGFEEHDKAFYYGDNVSYRFIGINNKRYLELLSDGTYKYDYRYQKYTDTYFHMGNYSFLDSNSLVLNTSYRCIENQFIVKEYSGTDTETFSITPQSIVSFMDDSTKQLKREYKVITADDLFIGLPTLFGVEISLNYRIDDSIATIFKGDIYKKQIKVDIDSNFMNAEEKYIMLRYPMEDTYDIPEDSIRYDLIHENTNMVELDFYSFTKIDHAAQSCFENTPAIIDSDTLRVFNGPTMDMHDKYIMTYPKK